MKKCKYCRPAPTLIMAKYWGRKPPLPKGGELYTCPRCGRWYPIVVLRGVDKWMDVMGGIRI